MDILPITEKQGGPAYKGGWQKDMARRRYQKGNLRKRGKRNPLWELQWWEDYIRENGSIGRRRQSAVLGLVSDLTQRQARKLAEERLRPVNQELLLPQSTQAFGDFVERYFVPLFFPTLKPSTQKRYRQTLTTHLLPAFGKYRLRDIGTVDLQRFVLQKMEGGLGWESANHLRNLVSKVFERATQWNCHSGLNPASGVSLPEKIPVREKHALTPEQIPHLLELLKEPVRTTVLLGILTGMRVGEILGLRRQGRRLCDGRDSYRTGQLSRLVRTAEDQRQQAITSHSPSSRRSARARMWTPRAIPRRVLGVSIPLMASHSAIRISCTGT